MTSVAEIAHALGRAQRLSGGGSSRRVPVLVTAKAGGDVRRVCRSAIAETSFRVHCHAGCDWRDVLVEACRRGLIDDRRSDIRHSPSLRRSGQSTRVVRADHVPPGRRISGRVASC